MNRIITINITLLFLTTPVYAYQELPWTELIVHPVEATDAAQNAILPMIGCDWIMFGPIEFAEFVFPAVAVVDTYILTATAELGTRPAVEGMHPLFKLVG